MATRLRFLLTALALNATVIARAESSSTASVPNRPLGLIMAALDTDRNGTLSATEIAAAPMALAALDSNADGLISPDERRAAHTQASPLPTARGPRAFSVILVLDANQDGKIQTMEIANAVSSLKRLDLNHDGELTREELRPALVAHHRA